MAVSIAMPWSDGEEKMHRLLHLPPQDNPTATMLTPQAAFMLQRAPLIAVGTLDAQGRPWSTIWGGQPGLSAPLGPNGMIGIRTHVDGLFDPVIEAMFGSKRDGQVLRQPEPKGSMVSGLPIDLMTRKRVKIFGRMIAGAVGKLEGAAADDSEGTTEYEAQLVVSVQQSLGNCPKYLNKKVITLAKENVAPKLLSSSTVLSPEALALIARADLFFVTSLNEKEEDMDTNIRGGPPGFVRILSNESSGAELVYPEYSGNRLYQTLGNLQSSPLAGVVFPDFETGDVLYATCQAEILIGRDASTVIPHANLAVKLKLTEARFVIKGLPFRGEKGEPSPYLPNVWPLAKEGSTAVKGAISEPPRATATLISKTAITPTITRYKFSLSSPMTYTIGQWVAMDFADELNIGYSHMRDDDPRSLNDDYIRTFTVSSSPLPKAGLDGITEFEITVRQSGPVTSFLSRQNERSGFEVPIKGFGGQFQIEMPSDGAVIPFVAGGIGITPLLSLLGTIPIDRLRLFWAIRIEDIALVSDVITQRSDLGPFTRIFVTEGKSKTASDGKQAIERLRELGVQVEYRRLCKEDLSAIQSRRWYICTGIGLRNSLLELLSEKEVIYEDFNF